MHGPLWFGDEIGVMPADGRADLTTTSLTKIEYGLCGKHGQHVLLKWNNGDVALATLQKDGFWLAEEDDLPRAKQESEMGRKVVQEIITRELESALAR